MYGNIERPPANQVQIRPTAPPSSQPTITGEIDYLEKLAEELLGCSGALLAKLSHSEPEKGVRPERAPGMVSALMEIKSTLQCARDAILAAHQIVG